MFNTRRVEIEVEALRGYMHDVLRAVGCSEQVACVLAEVHLDADLRGAGLQGLNHLINSHVAKLRSGAEVASATPVIISQGGAFGLVDGRFGPGPLAAIFAADLAVEKARSTGCAAVGVVNSHDLYMAGYYVDRIARQGLVGLLFSDDVVPVVHPVGGSEPVIGSNPMAIAIPSQDTPFLIDFTPTETVPTNIRYAARYGIPLPVGVAHTATGAPATDPALVADGSTWQSDRGGIAPLGHKGYGLLLAIDFLSGALVGADMGTDHATKDRARKGHLLLAIDPAAFGDIEAFRGAVSARIRQVKASRVAVGQGPIRIPGERSDQARSKALATDRVSIDEICWHDAVILARELDVRVPDVMPVGER